MFVFGTYYCKRGFIVWKASDIYDDIITENKPIAEV